jgi:hypothetical protein
MTKPVLLSQGDLEDLQLGRSMRLAGMKHAVRILQSQIELTEKQLHAGDVLDVDVMSVSNGTEVIKASMVRTLAKAGIALPAPSAKRRVVKSKRDKRVGGDGIKGYWAGMTEKERSAEMKRRYAKRRVDRALKTATNQPNHPRNPGHPKHEEWLAKMRKAMRKTWKNLAPEERERRIGAALAGRGAKRKQVPTVTMEQ